jgi:hypothetical protein
LHCGYLPQAAARSTSWYAGGSFGPLFSISFALGVVTNTKIGKGPARLNVKPLRTRWEFLSPILPLGNLDDQNVRGIRWAECPEPLSRHWNNLLAVTLGFFNSQDRSCATISHSRHLSTKASIQLLQPKTPIADVADTVPVVRGFDALV